MWHFGNSSTWIETMSLNSVIHNVYGGDVQKPTSKIFIAYCVESLTIPG